MNFLYTKENSLIKFIELCNSWGYRHLRSTVQENLQNDRKVSDGKFDLKIKKFNGSYFGLHPNDKLGVLAESFNRRYLAQDSLMYRSAYIQYLRQVLVDYRVWIPAQYHEWKLLKRYVN